jgi:hypothetical protein
MQQSASCAILICNMAGHMHAIDLFYAFPALNV